MKKIKCVEGLSPTSWWDANDETFAIGGVSYQTSATNWLGEKKHYKWHKLLLDNPKININLWDKEVKTKD
jgi:hypothetical protein